MGIQVLLLLLSFLILYYGAEFALDGAEKIGKILGLSPLVIGLIIIGFGTSLPEMFVSHIACIDGVPDVAIGNIVGSNISNLFLILGFSGIMVSLGMKAKGILVQTIMHVIVTVLLIFSLSFKVIPWFASVALIAFFIFYLYWTYSKMKEDDIHDDDPPPPLNWIIITKLFLGFLFLYLGGELLVTSGTKLATALGISSYIISAIFVAFGTSFPELVTAILACVRKKDVNLITGNIIGSNIFNVALIMGSMGVYNIEIKQSFLIEFIVLGFAAMYMFVLAWTKVKFHRFSGILFLMTYVGVVLYWVKG
jgi:cation:H+ antiporter